MSWLVESGNSALSRNVSIRPQTSFKQQRLSSCVLPEETRPSAGTQTQQTACSSSCYASIKSRQVVRHWDVFTNSESAQGSLIIAQDVVNVFHQTQLCETKAFKFLEWDGVSGFFVLFIFRLGPNLLVSINTSPAFAICSIQLLMNIFWM